MDSLPGCRPRCPRTAQKGKFYTDRYSPCISKSFVFFLLASSKSSQVGESFAARISQPVVVDGKAVIPKGARAVGRVVNAKEAGAAEGRGADCSNFDLH
jgi:hypothetical protein